MDKKPSEGMTREQEIEFMKYVNENLRPVMKKSLELGDKLSPAMERLARSGVNFKEEEE